MLIFASYPERPSMAIYESTVQPMLPAKDILTFRSAVEGRGWLGEQHRREFGVTVTVTMVRYHIAG